MGNKEGRWEKAEEREWEGERGDKGAGVKAMVPKFSLLWQNHDCNNNIHLFMKAPYPISIVWRMYFQYLVYGGHIQAIAAFSHHLPVSVSANMETYLVSVV